MLCNELVNFHLLNINQFSYINPMKKFYFLLLAAFYAVVPVFAQFPAIQWQKTIGGSDNDYLTDLQQTSDGGYILGGHSSSNISGDKNENGIGCFDYWLVKLDSGGNLRWQKTIMGDLQQSIHLLQMAADGGYLLGGNVWCDTARTLADHDFGHQDCRIIKLNADGNTQWQKTIGDGRHNYLFSVYPTADSGCILHGNYQYKLSGFQNLDSMEDVGVECWIIKLDKAGRIQWQNSMEDKVIAAVQLTPDGGCILGGSARSDTTGEVSPKSSGYYNYWIAKLDAAGKMQWQHKINRKNWDYIITLQKTADGGYIAFGPSQSIMPFNPLTGNGSLFAEQDYWLFKLNADGELQWQNSLGLAKYSGQPTFQLTSNGRYFVQGYYTSFLLRSGDGPQNYYTWVAKLDTAGSRQWQHYEDVRYNRSSLFPSADGGYLFADIQDWRFACEDTSVLKNMDYKIAKFNSVGKEEWRKSFGGDSSDLLQCIRLTSDGGYLLGGCSRSNISGNKTENCLGEYDYWVVKLAPDDSLTRHR